jgi:hypothetical protein
MPKTETSRGRDLAQRLQAACAQAGHTPLPGARDLPVLRGLTPKSVTDEPLENVLARAIAILVASKCVFLYGEDIYYEWIEGMTRRLVPLSRGNLVEVTAAAILANLVVCEHAAPDKGPIQFPPPRPIVGVLLNCAPLRNALPLILVYARRPVFDGDYNLLGPGWHPGPRVLVHGPAVEPVPWSEPDPSLPVLERLPYHLRTILGGFCFRDAADVANAVGAMVTALLVTLFVSVGKALVLLDGNQPGLGKTLFARILGILLDGVDPALIHFATDDEELGKRICATLRSSAQSLVLIDNAKVRAGDAVNSRVIEANSMAPQIALRILGQSANYTRPNDVMWVMTMNDTKASPDLVSRGCPIRLSYEGDPGKRQFGVADPIAFALEHRAEVLGELAGMVVCWNQKGRPPGPRGHRCEVWARTVGGILDAAGLPEFLTNLDEAAASFNTVLDELAALAEAAVAAGDPATVTFTKFQD